MIFEVTHKWKETRRSKRSEECLCMS